MSVPKSELTNYSTLRYFYNAVLGPQGDAPPPKLTTPQFPSAITVDVRDAARAHVLALSAPPTATVGRKRLLVAGPPLMWKGAVEHLAVARPDVKHRLADVSEAGETKVARVDVSRAREVLGLETYIDWKKTVEDMVDSVLAAESASE